MSAPMMYDEDDSSTSGITTPGSEPDTSNSATREPADYPQDHAARVSAARYGCALDDPQCKDMILVMGARGAGKSLFINTIVGGDVVRVGDGIIPSTRSCLLVPTRIGKTKVILIDTPGCEGYRNNAGALFFTQIFTTLARQYQRGISLRGIIYLQRIPLEQELRSPSPDIIYKMFRDICGDSNLFFHNIILATRGWQLPGLDESVAAMRESQFHQSWTQILARGATMARYYGERDSAVSMVSRILGNIDLPYEAEEELARKGDDLLSEMRSNVARDIERLLQQGILLSDD